jgi:hypothetical protein
MATIDSLILFPFFYFSCPSIAAALFALFLLQSCHQKNGGWLLLLLLWRVSLCVALIWLPLFLFFSFFFRRLVFSLVDPPLYIVTFFFFFFFFFFWV